MAATGAGQSGEITSGAGGIESQMAERDRRIHERMSGVEGGAVDHQRGCDRILSGVFVAHGVPAHIRSDSCARGVTNAGMW